MYRASISHSPKLLLLFPVSTGSQHNSVCLIIFGCVRNDELLFFFYPLRFSSTRYILSRHCAQDSCSAGAFLFLRGREARRPFSETHPQHERNKLQMYEKEAAGDALLSGTG